MNQEQIDLIKQLIKPLLLQKFKAIRELDNYYAKEKTKTLENLKQQKELITKQILNDDWLS